MRELVRDRSPGELRKINGTKLKDMGLEEALIDAFLDNYSYNPYEETLLVGELESMKGVQGFEEFIAAASLATDDSIARFYRLSAQMMAAYHRNVAPAIRIRNIDGNLRLQRKNGVFLILQPLDFAFWTKDVERYMNIADSRLEKTKEVSRKEM